MSESTVGDCRECGHPTHNGPCGTLVIWDRPGGSPGNGICQCGHPPIQQTVTYTGQAEIEQLRAQLAERDAEIADHHEMRQDTLRSFEATMADLAACQEKLAAAERAAHIPDEDYWDQNSVQCGNCSIEILTRKGTLLGNNGLSRAEGEDEALCGRCAGDQMYEYLDQLDKLQPEIEALKRERDELAATVRTGICNFLVSYANLEKWVQASDRDEIRHFVGHAIEYIRDGSYATPAEWLAGEGTKG